MRASSWKHQKLRESFIAIDVVWRAWHIVPIKQQWLRFGELLCRAKTASAAFNGQAFAVCNFPVLARFSGRNLSGGRVSVD